MSRNMLRAIGSSPAALVAANFATGLVEDGEGLPVPSTLDEVAEHPLFAGSAAVCLVDAKDLVRTERINCTFRADVLRQIDEAVERLGTNRSAFLASAALERLRRDASRGG
jgi:hypothetical protein